MKENTKEYIKDLLDDLTIELNTLDGILADAMRTRRKLQKFFKKAFKIY